MLPLQRFEGLLIGLWFYIINRFFRRAENAVPKTYLAYSIGPEMLAIAVRELEAQNDEAALSEATPLFHDGLKRIEVWCGSRSAAPRRGEHLRLTVTTSRGHAGARSAVLMVPRISADAEAAWAVRAATGDDRESRLLEQIPVRSTRSPHAGRNSGIPVC
jgi:hypothetical protein